MLGGLGFPHFTRLLVLLGAILCLQTGCAPKNSSGDANVPGMGSFNFAIADGRAQLAVAFTALKIDAGARILIPGLKESYVEIGPDFESGGALFVTSVSISELFRNTSGLTNFGLTDGRSIPGVRAGFLPGRVVQLPLFGNSLFYQGLDLFGVFLPVDFGAFPLNVTTRMRDAQGNIVGVLTAVAKGSKNGASGALFLFPVDGGQSQKMLIANLSKG
jgi:hypothetical protein